MIPLASVHGWSDDKHAAQDHLREALKHATSMKFKLKVRSRQVIIKSSTCPVLKPLESVHGQNQIAHAAQDHHKEVLKHTADKMGDNDSI